MDQDNMPGSGVDRRGFLKLSVWGGAALAVGAGALRREAQALKDNPELIQLRIAEKWNGQLPQVTGEGALPLLNIDAIQGRR